MALAVYSSIQDLSVPIGWVAFGEVGLAGDARRVPGVRQRVGEAARLGMTDVVLPRADAEQVGDVPIRLHPVDDVADALLVTPWVHPDLHHARTTRGPRALGAL